MSSPFDGRTALVTGAGRGIGRAVALALADAGADLVLLARSGTELASAADEIRAKGRGAEIVVADLSRVDTLPRVRESILQVTDHVDILINNAATVAPLGPTDEVSPDVFVSALVLNVVAVAALSGTVLPGMKERGWGRIVNLSTGLVSRPASMRGGNVYVSTKAALEAHTVNLAAETDLTGVTVNAYRPGIVDTTMQSWIRDQDPQEIGAELHQYFVTTYEEGRLITAEQSAAALLAHLASDDNGAIWTVDAPPATA